MNLSIVRKHDDESGYRVLIFSLNIDPDDKISLLRFFVDLIVKIMLMVWRE